MGLEAEENVVCLPTISGSPARLVPLRADLELWRALGGLGRTGLKLVTSAELKRWVLPALRRPSHPLCVYCCAVGVTALLRRAVRAVGILCRALLRGA